MIKLTNFFLTTGVLLQLAFANPAISAEAYQPPAPSAPEYTETIDHEGRPVILKRYVESETVVTPLACIYFSGNLSGGAVPVSGFVVGYGPYTSSCVGAHSFDLLTDNPLLTDLDLQLERQSGSSWVPVATGASSIAYFSAPVGTYRLVVINVSSVAATSWTGKYKIPN